MDRVIRAHFSINNTVDVRFNSTLDSFNLTWTVKIFCFRRRCYYELKLTIIAQYRGMGYLLRLTLQVSDIFKRVPPPPNLLPVLALRSDIILAHLYFLAIRYTSLVPGLASIFYTHPNIPHNVFFAHILPGQPIYLISVASLAV